MSGFWKKQEDLRILAVLGVENSKISLKRSLYIKFVFWFFCKTCKKLSDTMSIFICPSLSREKKSKLQTSYKGTFWCKFLNFECPALLRSPLNYSFPYTLWYSCFFRSTHSFLLRMFFAKRVKNRQTLCPFSFVCLCQERRNQSFKLHV